MNKRERFFNACFLVSAVGAGAGIPFGLPWLAIGSIILGAVSIKGIHIFSQMDEG